MQIKRWNTGMTKEKDGIFEWMNKKRWQDWMKKSKERIHTIELEGIDI